MKKQVLFIGVLVGGIMLSMSSCTYRGQCECDLGPVNVSTDEQEFDNRKDYRDAKEACEDAGCNWKIL